MLKKYVLKVSDEDIEKLIASALAKEWYPGDLYVNGILYTLEWLFQLDLWELGEPLLPPVPLDGS